MIGMPRDGLAGDDMRRVGRPLGARFGFGSTKPMPTGRLVFIDAATLLRAMLVAAAVFLVAFREIEFTRATSRMVGAILRRLGHVAICVENGRLAVEVATFRRFDCILMDMQMPEMDGLAATRAIRTSGGPSADAPIIALTADASSERRRFYDGAGLSDFMTKLIDRKALGNRLAAIAQATVVPVDSLADPAAAQGVLFDLDRYHELCDVLVDPK